MTDRVDLTRCDCGLEMFPSDRGVCLACDTCVQCKGPLSEPHYSGDDDPFCSRGCLESWEVAESERAYERFVEAFYGGEVVTLEEQQREARRVK
jgi:hypothetical protein